MATAAGTLVLAVATFSAVKSGNRSARVAERSLLAAQRPILIPSREDDPTEVVRFGDGIIVNVPGHGYALEMHDGQIYMAIGVRNGGAGVAVLHSWQVLVMPRTGGSPPPEFDRFRPQLRDLYIPAGANGFWQGAIRDAADPAYGSVRAALEAGERLMVDLLYSDHEGGQRAVARFGIGAVPDAAGERADVLRYWNVDGDDPREHD